MKEILLVILSAIIVLGILALMIFGAYIGITTFIELIDAELIHITLIQVGKLLIGLFSMYFIIGLILAILKKYIIEEL